MASQLKSLSLVVCGLSLLFLAHPVSADDNVIVTTPSTLPNNLVITAPTSAGDKKTLAETIAFQARDLSCDKNEDCKSIGFGDKACGGFQSYKIYSTKTLNESDFKKLVRDYNDWEKEENKDNGMASTCDVILEPAVACLQGRCAVLNIGTTTNTQ